MPAWVVKEEVRELFPDHAAAIGAPGEEINGNWMSRLVRCRDGNDYYYIKTSSTFAECLSLAPCVSMLCCAHNVIMIIINKSTHTHTHTQTAVACKL